MALSVFIPYFDEDSDARPLAPQYSIGACENIQPDGRKGNTYAGRGPNYPFSTFVKVRVRGLSSPTTILLSLYFNPFGTISWNKLANFGSQARMAVISDGDYLLSAQGYIFDDAPPHVCMLALAWSADEHYNPVATDPQPGTDKHWAQLNLADIFVPMAPSGRQPFDVFFNAGNPSKASEKYLLQVRLVKGTELATLRSLTGKQLSEPKDVDFWFHDNVTGSKSVPDGPAQAMSGLSLSPREDRPFSLVGSIGRSLQPGTCFAISVDQYTGAEPDPKVRVGGCVVLVTVSFAPAAPQA
ncbi:MAG: hypothetical protein WC889_04070 [Myxococcota bacterium]